MDQRRRDRIAEITSRQQLDTGDQSPTEQELMKWRREIENEALEADGGRQRRRSSMSRKLGKAAATELEPEPQEPQAS